MDASGQPASTQHQLMDFEIPRTQGTSTGSRCLCEVAHTKLLYLSILTSGDRRPKAALIKPTPAVDGIRSAASCGVATWRSTRSLLSGELRSTSGSQLEILCCLGCFSRVCEILPGFRRLRARPGCLELFSVCTFSLCPSGPAVAAPDVVSNRGSAMASSTAAATDAIALLTDCLRRIGPEPRICEMAQEGAGLC